MHPLSPTGLYWSTLGEVACATHAPSADDPRWATEDWPRSSLKTAKSGRCGTSISASTARRMAAPSSDSRSKKRQN
jgi:hypothetical protein